MPFAKMVRANRFFGSSKPTLSKEFYLSKQLPLVPGWEVHVRAIISRVKFCISLKAGHDMQIFLYLELYHFNQNLSFVLSQATQIIALGMQEVYTYFFSFLEVSKITKVVLWR